jgi:EAL domain-containing protein (putative c-di-GMP-specific phosphodiesterase class I)
MENQLSIYYQAQIEIETGKVIGAEALLRWNHPERGFISPVTFIPIAEATGQIIAIGQWVLETVCSTVTRWKNELQKNLTVSVNLSRRQLIQGSIAESICKILTNTGCSGRSIELEITEGFLMESPEKARKELQSLQDLGIQVAIDDFGTGYSSLSYLKHFPVNRLKIDQSFINDIKNDPDDQAITRAIIALGNSLGLEIIAEGVENKAQENYLISTGCRHAQGFYYHKPMPESEFLQFLNEKSLRK